ncbi:MAG: mycoredoxin [Anaerolineales bacterium]
MSEKSDYYSTHPSQIVMYTTAWCPDCRRARFFMKRNKIDFLEIDVNEDKQAAEFVKKLNNGNRSVPTIIFPDGSRMVEPSETELADKLR